MITGKHLYCMYLSFAGAIFFFFIGFSCFVGMEVLRLKEGTRALRGFEALLVSIIYGGIGGYIYYKKNYEEEQNRLYSGMFSQEDIVNENLKNRLG